MVGTGGRVSVSLNGGKATAIDLPAGDGWGQATTPALPFLEGTNTLIVQAEDCAACRVRALRVEP